MKGKIKFFKKRNGWGFIIRDKSFEEYFFHYSNVHEFKPHKMTQGNTVSFDISANEQGPCAVNIRVDRVISNYTVGSNIKKKIKANPFTPQDPITDPSKFAGRKDNICDAVDAICNNKNILITGRRGIGKTSTITQLAYLTEGEKHFLRKYSIDVGVYSFKHIISSHKCTEGNSLFEIANSLLHSLVKKIGEEFIPSKKSNKSAVDIKVIKYSKSTDYEKLNLTDMTSFFVNQVEEIILKSNLDYTGIVFVIDEIDVLEDQIDLGSFFKAVIEKFRLDGYLSISFLVGGVTGATTRLLREHKSAMRLFHVLDLKKMSYEELEELVDITLFEWETTISKDAVEKLIYYSDGMPQPVHELGYHAYRLDVNHLIDSNDILSSRDYLIEHQKDFTFNQLFQSLLPTQIEILKAIAISRSDRAPFNYIANKLPSETDDKILEHLSILIKDEVLYSEYYKYFFVDSLFRSFIKKKFGIHDYF